MSIKQLKPDLFLLDVRVWKDGKEYRKREEVQGGKKAAEARSHEIRKDLQDRAQKEPRSLTITTFKNILEYYLERNSIDKCSESYFRRLKDDLGNVRINDLQGRFDRYLLLLRQSKGKLTGRPLTNNTVNRILAWSKAAVNFALIAGVIEKNPLQHFQKLPTQPRDRMLNEDEKERLIEAVKTETPHIYPIMLFSLLVPSRRGELVSLKRTDYDMVNNCITIPAERTKNKRPCIKPVPDCLKEYMRNVPVESEYLFFRRDWRGRYLPLGNFRKSFKKCLQKAGIENYRFHDQRRVAYTDLLLAGNAPHIVMQVSGHKTDMSKVYFGRNELLAAKSVNFGAKPDSLTGHLKVVAL
ncbi:MAG: site-specific integrase [Chitinivibrionales bacterium]|nr:site-specific integrase [Chitinivibrionales bacterium]